MAVTRNIQGATDVYKALEHMKASVSAKVQRPALTKAGRLGVKHVKATIPSRLKELRKAIGSRTLKMKNSGGIVTVKVGVAVGKRSAKAKVSTKDRTNRPGVGISKQNAHWFFLGTSHRWQGLRIRRSKSGSVKISRTGNALKYTGKMPAQVPAVEATLAAHASSLKALIEREMAANLAKEAAKARRK
jgi:hypothetical protein